MVRSSVTAHKISRALFPTKKHMFCYGVILDKLGQVFLSIKEGDMGVYGIAVWSVHSSANLIFYFSNKNGKRKYYLSLSYLHIFKYGQK